MTTQIEGSHAHSDGPRPLGWTAPKVVPGPSEHRPSKIRANCGPVADLKILRWLQSGAVRSLGAATSPGARRSGFTATLRRSLPNLDGSSVHRDAAAVAGLWQAGVWRPSETTVLLIRRVSPASSLLERFPQHPEMKETTWVLSARFNRSRWPSQPSASVGLLVGREWNIRYMKVFCEPQSTQHNVCAHCDWEKCWDDPPPGGCPVASLRAPVQLLEVAAFLLCCIRVPSGHRKRILNWLQSGRLLRGSFLLPPISFFISGCCCGNESCNLQTAASGDSHRRDDGAGLAESAFYLRGEVWFRAQIFWCPRGSVMRSNLSPAPSLARDLHWHFCTWHFWLVTLAFWREAV